MNILIFSTVFYPGIGGIENQTLLLAKEFVTRGHLVRVITYQSPADSLPDIEVFYRPGMRKSVELFLWCSTYYMPNISLKGIWLLLFNPKKNWVISHNDFSSCNRTGILPGLKNICNKFSSTNIAVSKSIADYLGPSTAVIYNCYDDSIFKLYPDEKRVFDFVFLGRLVTQKGCDLLIRACSRLGQPFTLGIIGQGPEEQSLKALTKRLGLEDSINFYGALRGESLARTLNRYKTMIVPSVLGEGFGMVVLEGLACGCQIIAAEAAGLSEAVGNYGSKFKMNDEAELSQLLKNSFTTRREPDSIINPDLEAHLKKHSRTAVADNYLKFFK